MIGSAVSSISRSSIASATGPSSYGSFGARLVRRLHPQVLRHERRRLLVERIRLAGDLEHDVHSAEPISALEVGAVILRASVHLLNLV